MPVKDQLKLIKFTDYLFTILVTLMICFVAAIVGYLVVKLLKVFLGMLLVVIAVDMLRHA